MAKEFKTPKHLQTKRFVVLKDLFSCIKEVETVEFVLGLDDCGDVVKINIDNLAAQIAETEE